MELVEFLKDSDFRFLGELLEGLIGAIDKAIEVIPYLIGMIVIFVVAYIWIDKKIKEAEKKAKKRSPKTARKRAS